MDELGTWLSSHGLGMYIDVFKENDLTLDLLSELDQSDLRELGLSLGHRKRFLQQVRHLPSNSTDLQLANSAPAEVSSNSERRQLTIMFCDLVDSTSLGRRIGAEDMQDLLRAYQELCIEAVNRYSGYIARYLGDGILVYFGYPQAHEQDADRAIRAGLTLVKLIAKLDADYQARYGINVRVRIGIATGQVVVGDIVGAGAAAENTVVGDAANLAARIQSLAPVNTVVVSTTTWRLCQFAFQFADHGQHLINGMAEPVQVWRAVSKLEQVSRFRATRPQGATALIGRDDELQVLLKRWQQVQQGEGQIIEITGEAGIGKSHLVDAFPGQSNFNQSDAILFQCSPYHTGSVLQPVLEQLQRDASTDGTPVTMESLQQYFKLAPEHQAEAVYYFGNQLSIKSDDLDELDDVLPQTIRQHAFDGWIDCLVSRSNRSPLIVILEDAHWLDTTSAEIFTQFIKRIHDYPILLLITARPEFNATWKNFRCLATPIQLERMQKIHGREIIKKIADQQTVPEPLIETVLDKTDGVPLFVEELTKSIIESGLLDNNSAVDGDTDFQIPETLHDLLMSRIDKNPSIKNILQIASAIGRDFAFQLLSTVASEDDSELEDLIKSVVEAEVVFESGVLPSSVYTFRHALIQDAAYQSLLLRNRRILHARIATALENKRDHSVSDELLAYHWSKGGESRKAVTYWHKAARVATFAWANGEAVHRYNNALAELAKTRTPEDCPKQELVLLLELGDALRAASGSSANDTITAFNRAAELCGRIDDIDLFVRSNYGAFTAYFTSAKLVLAKSVAVTLLSKAISENHTAGTAAGHQALGMYEFATGNFEQAQLQFELALKFRDKIECNFDFQFPVLSQSYLSWTLYLTGSQQDALNLMDQAITESKSVSTYNQALAMANACYLHQFGGDTQSLAELTTELKIFSLEKGFPVWHAVAEFFYCWQQCQTDQSIDALNHLVQALEFWAEDEIETPYFKSIVAETLSAADQYERAHKLEDEAQTLMTETGEIWYRCWQSYLSKTA